MKIGKLVSKKLDGGSKIFLLPLRPALVPVPVPTDAESTSHPPLPCVSEIELLDEVLRLLTVPVDDVPGYENSNGHWHYSSIIPAIKYVRSKTDWSLYEAKNYVDKIHKEFAGQISAAKVLSSQYLPDPRQSRKRQ